MGEIGEYWRDVKAHKKAQKLAKPQHRRCWDWMIVSGNNYARNRSSFKTYRRVKGTAGGAKVIGIGTVELQVRRSPTSKETGTLVLEDVLHIPRAICNGVNLVQYKDWSTSFGDGSAWGHDRNGKLMWYATPYCGLNRLVLAGNPQGETYLQEREGVFYSLSVFQSEEEEFEMLLSEVKDLDVKLSLRAYIAVVLELEDSSFFTEACNDIRKQLAPYGISKLMGTPE
jgi:hypothetical protein